MNQVNKNAPMCFSCQKNKIESMHNRAGELRAQRQPKTVFTTDKSNQIYSSKFKNCYNIQLIKRATHRPELLNFDNSAKTDRKTYAATIVD